MTVWIDLGPHNMGITWTDTHLLFKSTLLISVNDVSVSTTELYHICVVWCFCILFGMILIVLVGSCGSGDRAGRPLTRSLLHSACPVLNPKLPLTALSTLCVCDGRLWLIGRVVVLQPEGRQFDPQSSQKICMPKCPWARCWTPDCAS